MDKISIVTGTLNRCNILPGLIENTINSDDRLELVLVDGGSQDNTIEYLKKINHPRIKLIEVGQRSSYPHFMNLGIQNASYEYICQWNDDVLLENDWQDVFNELDDNHQAYLFSWTNHNSNQWNLLNNGPRKGEVVMNYGIYHKDVFRKCGLYNMRYKYYCADGEMAIRAYCMGIKFKTCHNIRVRVLPIDKVAIHDSEMIPIYYQSVIDYHSGNINMEGVELL